MRLSQDEKKFDYMFNVQTQNTDVWQTNSGVADHAYIMLLQASRGKIRVCPI